LPATLFDETVIDATLELASQVPVQPVDLEVVIRSTTLRRRHRLPHWDATIVAAAQTLGCHTLYSEDLSHDQVLDGLHIVNPFR
jgi:predicted nucleic acid-binding protein